MDNDILKYGDFIILYGFNAPEIYSPINNPDSEKLQSGTEAGFLSAIGQTDNRVFLQRVPHVTNPLVSAAELNNHQDLVFQVWPKLSCEAHKQMRKFKKERQIVYDTINNIEKENFQVLFDKLDSRVQEELKAHQRSLRQIFGNPVSYGSDVQFMHVDSRNFLKAEIASSQVEKTAYRFELSNEFSSRMAFKIKPKYNVRQEGEPIQFGDEILIHSGKLDCYVNFSLNEHIEIDMDVNIPSNLPFITKKFEINKLNRGSKRYEAHVSQFQDCIWRVYFYGSNKEEDSVRVKGGDLIRFKHSQIGAYLAADIAMETDNPEVYGRLYYGQFHEEQNALSTIWSVEIDNEHDKNVTCEILDDGKQYKTLRLRHILTGRALHFGAATFKRELHNWKLPILSADTSNYLVAFHSFANNPKKELYYNTAYGMCFKTGESGPMRYITTHPTKDYADLVNSADVSLDEEHSKLSQHVKVFKPLDDSEFYTKKRTFIAEVVTPSAEHAFIIQRVNPEEEADIALAASTIPMLSHFRDLVKSCDTQINSETFPKVISAMRSLIIFLHKNVPKLMDDFDPLTFDGVKIPSRQKLLKDIGLIDILTEILYYPFYFNMFTLQKIEDNNFIEVFQYCYTLIRHIINEFRPNELYASQWLELYMHQALAPNNVDIKAEATLIELIDNNEKILNTKIDSRIIRHFVDLLKQTKQEKFINLLQALIVCNNQAVLKNQTETSRLIFEDPEVCKALIPKLRIRGDEVEIWTDIYNKDPADAWTSISEFNRWSYQRDSGKHFEYFTGLVHLFANLCLERNYIAINYLQDIFTYDICFKVVSDKDKYADFWPIKAAFTRLMKTLWIDRKPYHPINLPTHIILWDDIGSKASEEILTTQNVSNFEGLMNNLLDYFNQLAEEGCTKIYEFERNKFTLLTLEITMDLARFGFYSTIDKLKSLARPLLILLNGMVDVMTRVEYEEFSKTNKKEAKNAGQFAGRRVGKRKTVVLKEVIEIVAQKHQETEETMIVMDCKNKICEIIKLIMDMGKDISVRRFLTEYKKKMEENRINSDKSLKNQEKQLSAFVQEIQLICENDYLDIRKLAPTNYTKILFDLLRYEHQGLVSNAFELLYMTYSKQNSLKNILQQVRFIEGEAKTSTVKTIEAKIKELSELSESSENWYIPTKSNGGQGLAEFERFSQLIKDLEGYLLVQESKKKALEMSRHIAHQGDEIETLLEGDEREAEYGSEGDSEIGNVFTINLEFQQILKHLKVHEPLINLLKFEYSERDNARTDLQTKLLNEITKFLAKFTYRHASTQDLLTPAMEDLFKMLKSYPDIGLENLIEEIFRNNRKLIKEPDTIKMFAENVIQLLKGKEIYSYKNSRLLQTLVVLMTHNGKALKMNQVTIITLLTSRENVQTFLGFTNKKEDLIAKLQAYDNKVPTLTGPNRMIELSAELDYIVSMIQVLSTAGEGKNIVSEAKTQGLLSLGYLVSLYEAAKRCWHFKFAVLNLVLHAYLDTEREKKEETGNFAKLLSLMVADMENLTSEQFDYEVVFSKGRISANTLRDMVYYRAILPCLNTFINKKIYRRIHDHEELFSKALRMILIADEKAGKLIYKKKLRSSLSTFKIFLRNIYTHVCASLKLVKSPMNLSFEIVGTLVLQEDLTMVGKDENSRVHQLKRTLERVSKRPDFLQNVHLELEKLIESLVDIETDPEQNQYSADLPFGEVVKSLVKAIDVNGHTTDKEQRRVGLLIFRKVIEDENKFESVPAADWDDTQWTKNEKIIKERQNNLCGLGVVEMVLNMISYSNDPDLQYEGLLLCIALLAGGNPAAQQTFLDYMQNDGENAFLFSIKTMIIGSFDTVKKALNEKNRTFMKKMQIILEKNRIETKQDDLLAKVVDGLEANESEVDEIISHIDHEEVHFQEISQALLTLKRIYKFLELLCHGHHFKLQSHLRCQKTEDGVVNRRTYDFITHTAYYYNGLVKQVNIDSLDLSVQMLDFMISTAQGPCEENQRVLIKANIINSCMDFLTAFQTKNDYMKRGFYTQDEMNLVEDPMITSMKLLNALIEASTDHDMIKEMDSLDFRFLIEKLATFYSAFVKKKFKLSPEIETPEYITSRMRADTFDEQMIESFDMYFLILKLSGHSHRAAASLTETEDYDQLTKNTLEFFKMNSANIEILFNEKLLRVYFPIYPVCNCLTKGTRLDLMQNINRSSPNEKIVGLIEASPQLFDEMEHMMHLKSQWFNFSIRKYNFLRDLSTLFSFLINLIIFTTAYWGVDNGETYPTERQLGKVQPTNINIIINYVQFFTCLVMITFWIIIYTPTILKAQWRELIKDKQLTPEEDLKLAELIDKRTIGGLPLKTVLNLLWRKGPYDQIFNKNGSKDFGHLYVRIMYIFKNLVFILSDGGFIYMLFYVLVSLGGLKISDILYCLHLLDVINRFDTLKNVVKAVTFNIKQLALTGFLGLILIYVYTIIGFVFLDDQYYNSDSNERTCTSMIQCYITTLNYGLRNGGGIGESLEMPSYASGARNNYFFRAVFDVSFFLIINIVFLNIVFGIIIDTFAELRDAKKAIEEDMKNVCFICNVDRYTIDKDGEGFIKHIENNHSLWNYVYFIYNLEKRNPLQYNGIESYVKEKLDVEDLSWFPQQRALELEPEDK